MKKLILSIISAIGLSTPALAQQQSIKLGTHNTVVVRGAIGGGSIIKAQMELADLVVKRAFQNYPIYIVFDSPGGSITAGKSFISFAKTINNLHTITIFSASMAAMITQILPGKRYVTEDGTYMFHRARGQFDGQFEEGELESQLKFWKRSVRDMESKISSRIGISLQDYKSKIANEWWTDAQESISQNVADNVVQITCSAALVKKEVSTSIMTIFGAYNLLYSGCPLFRYPLPKEN